MLPLGPTSLAVADAITHYRQLRELTRDELSYVLATNGSDLQVDDIRGIEDGLQLISVNDLVAIAYALDVSPSVLLSHIPIDMPSPEGPLATGLPNDVDQGELRAWLEGRTALDHRSRVQWAEDRASRLRVRSTHIEEQLQGAYEEIRSLGELAEREADMPPVVRLQQRIRESEYELNQADIALAYAERRLEQLQGVDH